MAVSFVAVSREKHVDKGWKRFSSYAFAAKFSTIPLVGAELAKAAMAMPIALLRQDDRFAFMAVVGLEPERNLFITDEGQWIGGYVPAALRGYPFALAKTTDEQRVLCIDEASGLMVDQDKAEERFFEDGGEIAPSVAAIVDFLDQVERNRSVTENACATLSDLGLIEEWPITLRTATGDKNIQGLFRVKEAGLGSLDDESCLKLWRAGALPLIYAQLLSMAHLPMLGRLAEAHAKRAEQMAKVMAESFMMPDAGDLQLNFD
jgi:hypothetical protein